VEAPEEIIEDVHLDIPDDEAMDDYEVFVPEEDDDLPEIVSGEYTKDMRNRTWE